jgi:RNA polymerase sigma factor (sigma-70 family)
LSGSRDDLDGSPLRFVDVGVKEVGPFADRRRKRWVKAAPRLLHRESEDDLAPEADERAAVLAALALLTPRQRTAVALRFWLDRTDAETADDMGCSVSTVRTHVADALKRLRAAGMGEGHEGVDDGSG